MLAIVHVFVYDSTIETTGKAGVKISEFKRWLESQGVQVMNGKSHWKLYYNGKQTVLPRHPSKELKEGTKRAILKQLGIN